MDEDVQIEAERGIGVATDRAISSALIGCSLVIISVAFLKQKSLLSPPYRRRAPLREILCTIKYQWIGHAILKLVIGGEQFLDSFRHSIACFKVRVDLRNRKVVSRKLFDISFKRKFLRFGSRLQTN